VLEVNLLDSDFLGVEGAEALTVWAAGAGVEARRARPRRAGRLREPASYCRVLGGLNTHTLTPSTLNTDTLNPHTLNTQHSHPHHGGADPWRCGWQARALKHDALVRGALAGSGSGKFTQTLIVTIGLQ